MDEKNQWGSDIKKKKHKTSKKKKHSAAVTAKLLHQPAPPCDGSASCLSSWSITKPTFHYLAPRDRCCTSLGPIYREECEVFSSTSPLSSANLYLRITFDKAKVLHDCSFCIQPKGKGKTKTTLCVTNRALSQTNGCAKRCILCFFLVCFFSRVGKNQWARVTRNKEKIRRGLTFETRSIAGVGHELSTALGANMRITSSLWTVLR